jgi:O-antigen ligase
MKLDVINKQLERTVIFAPVIVSLLVSPGSAIDPINLPKLVLLGFLAPISLVLGITTVVKSKNGFSRTLLVSILLFVVCLSLVLAIHGGDLAFHFYGTPARNTGFLAYLSLSMLLFAAAAAASADLIQKYSITLIGLGTMMAVYGIAQWQGLDFFTYVNIYGSDVFGTFGNPNFHSAFMGVVASVSMTWTLFSSLNLRVKTILLSITALSITNVFLSSDQGYLNFLAGITAALVIFLFSKGKQIAAWCVLGASGLGAMLLVFGIFNSGPLASLVYKSSLQARGFYWRAAINMMQENPFFGVGLDNFGDWYRRSRTQASAEFNPGLVADTAHSIPLDIGASGGFPLVILYFLILGLVVVSIIKVVRRNAGFNVAFASIVAAWVAYQAQSVISINQLGLGVWGWSLTGLLIGYEFKTRILKPHEAGKSLKKREQMKEELSPATLLVPFMVGIIGLMVSVPPYLAANKYYAALQSGDGTILQQSAYLKPYDRTRFLFTAQIFVENKLDSQAIQVLSDATKIYPDSFELWQRWSLIPSATPEQVLKAKSEMKRLDPFNPDLK